MSRRAESVFFHRLLPLSAILMLLVLVVGLLVSGSRMLLPSDQTYAWSTELPQEYQDDLGAAVASNAVNTSHADSTTLIQRIERLPWVDQVRIRYHIGYRMIDVTLYVPVAILNDRWFLSSSGKRKNIVDKKSYTDLIRYYYDPQQQQTLLPQAKALQQQLQAIGLSVGELRVSAAGNWTVLTKSGIEIHFGIEKLADKVLRLEKMLDPIMAKGTPERLDMRNVAGIAVKYAQDSGTP